MECLALFHTVHRRVRTGFARYPTPCARLRITASSACLLRPAGIASRASAGRLRGGTSVKPLRLAVPADPARSRALLATTAARFLALSRRSGRSTLLWDLVGGRCSRRRRRQLRRGSAAVAAGFMTQLTSTASGVWPQQHGLRDGLRHGRERGPRLPRRRKYGEGGSPRSRAVAELRQICITEFSGLRLPSLCVSPTAGRSSSRTLLRMRPYGTTTRVATAQRMCLQAT